MKYSKYCAIKFISDLIFWICCSFFFGYYDVEHNILAAYVFVSVVNIIGAIGRYRINIEKDG